MQLRKVRIQNFKGLDDVELDLTGHDDQPRRITLLRGANGSGKTSVMQAIALTLSLATRRIRGPEELGWHGFLADRLGTRGKTRIELEVQFADTELDAIQAVFERWKVAQPPFFEAIEPGRHERVNLVYEGGNVTAVEGTAAFFQFFGRYYVKTLLRRIPDVRRFFREVGDVFWFDQHRNLGSRAERDASTAVDVWTAGVEQLRQHLISWWSYHCSPGVVPERDFIAGIEGLYSKVFPGTRLVGTEPRSDASDPSGSEFLFLLERDGLKYDLAEMSSGEQAVFPILSECVRLAIRRSVMLIDELELHLHPPQQQALLSALRHLAPDSQFLLTTHSPYLVDVIPDDWTYTLRGGRAWR